MTNHTEALVRQAYQAYTQGDLSGVLELVDPDLEWTYLNPAFADPVPATCHGRDQLRMALQRQASPAWTGCGSGRAATGHRGRDVTKRPRLRATRASAGSRTPALPG